MKTRATIISLLFLLLIGCNLNNSEVKIEKFSEDKPYAIEISRERSLYQAEKISNRLIAMGLKSYIIKHSDTLKNDGEWYYVLCDNIEHFDSAIILTNHLESEFDLQELKVVVFEDFRNASFDINPFRQIEKKQIIAEKPGINEDVFNVLSMFPESNLLYVEKSFIISSPPDEKNPKGYDIVYSWKTDLPRGISKKLILEKTTAFAEVIYRDNLYGDRVTIDIGTLRNRPPIINQASIINLSNKKSFEIAEEFADLILETGTYLTEEKEEIEISSFTKLYGYKVTIEPRRDYFRTYLILVDENNQYILFCQSTDKDEKDLISILSNVGKGNGLLNFDEFYNTFFTIPDNIVDNDHFIGFSMDKLNHTYAQSKGNSKWSLEMVGHWCADAYFHNVRNGLWTYSIFDLLTAENQQYIYGDLYYSGFIDSEQKISIYNTEGAIIFSTRWDSSKWEYYEIAKEINFGIDRYVCAVGNTENSNFAKDELFERAESLQFESEKKEEKPII